MNEKEITEAFSCMSCSAIHGEEPALVVMAAGMGSRFGGLKQIAPIGRHGEPILAFSLYDAYKAGFRRFVFVIKPEMETDFRHLLVDKLPLPYMTDGAPEVQLVFQTLDDIPEGFDLPEGRTKPWGTGHAVYAARDVIHGPFAVINSDDYYGPEGFGLVYSFLHNAETGGRYCMVAFDLGNTLSENGTVSRGVCVTEDGLLKHVVEQTEIRREGDNACSKEGYFGKMPLDTPVSMNLWGFTPDFMTQMRGRFPEFLVKALLLNPLKGEYQLPGVVDVTIREGLSQVTVLRSRDRWYGVTYKEDLETVQQALQERQDGVHYPEQLL